MGRSVDGVRETRNKRTDEACQPSPTTANLRPSQQLAVRRSETLCDGGENGLSTYTNSSAMCGTGRAAETVSHCRSHRPRQHTRTTGQSSHSNESSVPLHMRVSSRFTFIPQHRHSLTVLAHSLHRPHSRLCPATKRPVVEHTERVGRVGRL